MEDLPDSVDKQTLIEIGIAQGIVDPEDKRPQDALSEYLSYVERDNTVATAETYRARLEDFVDWCDTVEIESTAQLDTGDLQEFYDWRRNNRDLSPSSLESYQKTLKRFIRYCCQRNHWARNDLHESVEIPNLKQDERSRDVTVPHETSKTIVAHLDKYEPYRCEHAVWALLAEAGLRICSLRSLDVDDFLTPDEGYFLQLRHRPDTGTRLKNGKASERVIKISSYTASVIKEYATGRRNDVEDEYGREPLLAPESGRISTSTLQKYVYRWTQPCQYTGECPYEDKSPETCAAAGNNERAHDCPGSEGPHAVRRGYITQMKKEHFSSDDVEHRCDVSKEVVDEHYDGRSEVEKARDHYRGTQQSVTETQPMAPFSSNQTAPPTSKPPEQDRMRSD